MNKLAERITSVECELCCSSDIVPIGPYWMCATCGAPSDEPKMTFHEMVVEAGNRM